MELARVKETIAFFDGKPAIYEEIIKSLGEVPISILANIMNNFRLFSVYKRSNCRKFLTVLDALDNLDDDHVLVFISELKLYGLFTHDDYLQFTKKLHEMFEEDNVTSNTYQVILNDGKQKIVFLCSNSEHAASATVDKIARHVKDFFGTTINTVENAGGTEITINKIIDGKNRHELFDDLFNYVHKRDPELAGKISLLRTYRDREYKYTIPKLQHVTTLEDLANILKTSANITFNGPVMINHIVGDGNIINQANAGDKKQTARDWVKNNPPNENEITTDYYKRYCEKNNQPTPNNQFGKIVEEFKFGRRSNGRERYWVKK